MSNYERTKPLMPALRELVSEHEYLSSTIERTDLYRQVKLLSGFAANLLWVVGKLVQERDEALAPEPRT